MSLCELEPVSIRITAAGRLVRIRRTASTPSSFGIAMSIRTTSGLSATASPTASSPLAALPTISSRSSVERIASSASANRRWSSAIRTRILGGIRLACPDRAFENRLDAPCLLRHIVPFGRLPGRRVRAGQLGGGGERRGDRVHVEGVDEHAGLRRDELGRPADAGSDDRAAAGHALQERLAEGLDQARLADDAGGGDPGGHVIVFDAAKDLDLAAPLELQAQRP